MTELPYGTWSSPISAADVARGGVGLYFPGLVLTPAGLETWWVEERPSQGGRHAIVKRLSDGTTEDVIGPEWSPRSRIMEYGAHSWCHVDNVGTVFCFWDDQRLYLLADGSSTPVALTPAGGEDVSHMYGEPIAGPAGYVMAVRESHRAGVVTRDLVMVPLDGSAAGAESGIRILNDEHHFYACPRLSPDGRRVSYVAWDHPDMPWDSTVVSVVDIAEEAQRELVLAGGKDESILQPEWADDDTLYCISDRSGWWNLYSLSVSRKVLTPLCPREEEFGQPLWELGETSYAMLGDGRLALAHGKGDAQLSLFDPTTGVLSDSGINVGIHYNIFSNGSTVVAIGRSDEMPLSIVTIDLAAATPTVNVARSSIDNLPDAAYLPSAEPRTFTGPKGLDIHAFIYPPKNPEAVAPAGERPPYLVFVHGGPTAHVSPGLALEKAYFTSRGIGVIDVNYGGSTGYGREYRERLRGQWGVVDVEDSVAAVQALAALGEADGKRLGIRGGSAGGWTTLACLVQSDAFAAGAAYFPVTDLLPFAQDTHDFESRYLDGLIGPLPEAHDLYVERSPL
ncbi:MAG TPA: prolyl oligopeptidase family serine peptidase, partial [Actinomycetes bacterium]|nr:prolyl oligopeptidase family serine peptidase [Actinomycetes bacterium]